MLPFIKSKQQQQSKPTAAMSREDCIRAISQVCNTEAISIDDLRKIVALIQDEKRLKRALIFL